MQANTPGIQADPGFKLPADKHTPDDPLPKTAPETAGGPVEIMPGALPPRTETATRDLAIGSAVFVLLLVVYFFVRNAYVHHLVVRRVAPSSAASAGWLLFVGLAFLSGAVVLALLNASKYLSFGVTLPLLLVGLGALVAALFIGRR
jgi:hypothetical protein